VSVHTQYLSSTAARTPVSATSPGRTGLAAWAVAVILVADVFSDRVSAGPEALLVLAGFYVGAELVSVDDGRSAQRVRQLCGALVRTVAPTLVVVIAVCGAFTLWLQPRTRWETFADHSLSSFGFIQNLQLAQSAGAYANAGEAVSPLQHLWLVSVVGQLVAAGCLVVLITRRRAVALGVFAALGVVSFWYAMVAHQTDQASAFYDTFARAWEPITGLLLASVAGRLHLADWLRMTVGSLGVAGLMWASWVVDGAQSYPGVLALVPVAATLLVVCARPSAVPVPGVVVVAAYLWHWPVLVFWLAHAVKDDVGLTDGLLVIAVSVVLAWLTQVLLGGLSIPLRRRVPAMVAAGLVVLLAVAVTAGSIGWRQYTNDVRANGGDLLYLSPTDYPGGRALLDGLRVPKLPVRPSVLEAAQDLPATIADRCISDFGDTTLRKCTYGDPRASRMIALAGGSHSEHWLAALNTIGQRHGFKVVTYLKMGCPMSTDALPRVSVSNDPYPGCRQWTDKAMASLVADRPDYVFLTTTRPVTDGPGDYVPSNYLGIWDRLLSNGIAILGVRDTPWMFQDGVLWSPVDCLADGGDPNSDSCGLPRSEVLSSYNPTMDYLGRYPGIAPLDFSDALCRPDFCRAVEGNVMVYHDAHHLSTTFVRTLTDEVARQLSMATGWW